MHSVLYVLVEADSEDEALNELDDFYGRWLSTDGPYGGPFDYYQVMDTSSRVSGASRWSDFQGEPIAVPADTAKGLQWLEQGWEATLNEYEQTLNRVQDEIEDRDVEEILEDSLLRHSFRMLASPERTDVHLYDATDGSRFEPMVLSAERWETLQNESYRTGAWVVPIDVHF